MNSNLVKRSMGQKKNLKWKGWGGGSIQQFWCRVHQAVVKKGLQPFAALVTTGQNQGRRSGEGKQVVSRSRYSQSIFGVWNGVREGGRAGERETMYALISSPLEAGVGALGLLWTKRDIRRLCRLASCLGRLVVVLEVSLSVVFVNSAVSSWFRA